MELVEYRSIDVIAINILPHFLQSQLHAILGELKRFQVHIHDHIRLNRDGESCNRSHRGYEDRKF